MLIHDLRVSRSGEAFKAASRAKEKRHAVRISFPFGCGGGTCNHRIARKCVRGRLFGAARSHPTRRGGSEVVRRLDFVSKKGTASMRMLFLFCIAPLKKISLSNPAGITEYLPFSGLPHSTRPLYPRHQLSFCYVFLPAVNFIYPGNTSLFCDIIVPEASGDLRFSL